jgi:hypothetical protein
MNSTQDITFVVEKNTAKRITIDFPKQDMTVSEWQEAYFKILAWKNTWDIPHEVDIKAYHDNTAYIVIVVDDDRYDGTLKLLENYGFKSIDAEDITIGLLDAYEADVDELYAE